MAGVGNGVTTHQNAFQNHELETLKRFGPLIGNRFHIHSHLWSGVKRFQNQLSSQQLHPFNRFNQLVVFKGQTLRRFDPEMGSIRLLDMTQIRKLGLIGDGVFLHRTEQ